MSQLRQQLLQTPFDEELAELVALAEHAVSDLAHPTECDQSTVVSPWIRIGDQVVRTIGMVARFDAPSDVTLDELRIELSYPFDAAAGRFFRNRVSAE